MKFGFYSKHNGKSLEVFKHNMVYVYNWENSLNYKTAWCMLWRKCQVEEPKAIRSEVTTKELGSQ